MYKPLLLLALATLPAYAAAPKNKPLQEEIERQFQTTTVNTVMDYPGEADAYRSDAQPDTLEIVFLSGPGKSEVRSDGEVLFLAADATDAEQEKLIAQAFEQRAKKALGIESKKK